MNIRKPLMRATVCDNKLDKLDVACLVFKTLTSVLLKQLQNVVVVLLESKAVLANFKAISGVVML